MAASFDVATLAVTGDSALILEGVRGVDYTFSGDVTLVYVPHLPLRTLVWVDRQGNERVVSEERRKYYTPQISPDGRRVAVTIVEQNKPNVWIYDLEEDWSRRLTFEGERNVGPIWTPDGKWITFTSNQRTNLRCHGV